MKVNIFVPEIEKVQMKFTGVALCIVFTSWLQVWKENNKFPNKHKVSNCVLIHTMVWLSHIKQCYKPNLPQYVVKSPKGSLTIVWDGLS